MSVLLRLCLSLVLLAPALVHAATLENPGNGSFYSGIGVVSGWKCTANGPLTVRFNGGSPIPLAYWNERPDVRDAGACPSAHVGFVAIMNWANLSDGTHTAVVYDNGVEFARSTFEVATTGESFVTGAEGECRVEDFPAPGESAQFSWNQSTQHLEMVGEDGNGDDGGRGVDDHGNTAQEATPVAVTSSTPGSLEPASDEDWFRLQVSSTGFLRLYPAGGGTWVELYRGEEVGKIVSWSEDRNAEVRLHDNGRDNQGNYFAHYRVVPDVYYAVVRGGATGPYQFDTRWTSSFQRGEDRHDPPAREGNGDTGESSGGSGGPDTLENPGNGSFYSGIGVVSGWKCTANGPLTVRFNGGDAIPLAYGNERSDVRDAGACPSAQVGFVSIMNWANLGDGTHTAVVYDNGVEFGRSTFEVATTGESFVTGAEGECRVEDFPAPGESMRFVWNEATQHLEMVGGSGGGSGDDDADGGGVCDRTPIIRDGIMRVLKRASCENITASALAGIEELDLRHINNDLTALKAGDLAGLTNLEELILYGNKLTSLPPDLFNGLTNLRVLGLSGNVLHDLQPVLFAGLTNLRDLHLSDNRLRYLQPLLFADLTNLQYLNLSDNYIDRLVYYEPGSPFTGLTNLRYLDLSSNGLNDILGDVFNDTRNLKTLLLNDNSLRQVRPGIFANIPCGAYINLKNNGSRGKSDSLQADRDRGGCRGSDGGGGGGGDNGGGGSAYKYRFSCHDPSATGACAEYAFTTQSDYTNFVDQCRNYGSRVLEGNCTPAPSCVHRTETRASRTFVYGRTEQWVRTHCENTSGEYISGPETPNHICNQACQEDAEALCEVIGGFCNWLR